MLIKDKEGWVGKLIIYYTIFQSKNHIILYFYTKPRQMVTRLLFIVFIALLSTGSASAQMGCTDIYATNYNPTASINDGSCVYPITHDTAMLRAQLQNKLTESSGLIWDNGKLWSHNDSGNPATFFSIDTTNGHILQTVYVDNYPNIDWEDITADSNYIYIGDFGNNTGDRTNLKILKIAKADIGPDTAVHVNAQAISFFYSDQVTFTSTQLNNFDCESLISVEDSLYVFTKDRLDQQTRMYRISKTPGTYTVPPIGNFNVGGLITAASYNAITHDIVLLGYTLLKTNSFLWYLNDYSGHMFFSGNKRRIEIGGSTEWQTEGITFISPTRFFISNETATVNASLFTLDKNWLSALELRNINSKPAAEVYPSPFTSTLYINNLSTKTNYRLTDLAGRPVANGILTANDNNIQLDMLQKGIYLLKLTDLNGNTSVKKIVKE